MFGLILLSLATVGALGGWFVGRLKRRRRWLAVLWILLPFCLYLPLTIPAAIYGGLDGLLIWLMVLGILGYPILAWAIPATVAFAVARYRDKIGGSLRAL